MGLAAGKPDTSWLVVAESMTPKFKARAAVVVPTNPTPT